MDSFTYEYHKKFYRKTEADELYNEILNNINFTQGQVKVYGKVYNEPRLTAIFGDDTERSYTYSNSKRKLESMPTIIQEIRNRIFEETGIYYDFVLLNYYRDGNDKIGWHSDDEIEMDCSNIASISFGETRKFKIRNGKSKEVITTFGLGNGDFFWMKDRFQELYQHSIPKESNKKDRINLTFRVFK